jgi:hypothetical protein
MPSGGRELSASLEAPSARRVRSAEPREASVAFSVAPRVLRDGASAGSYSTSDSSPSSSPSPSSLLVLVGCGVRLGSSTSSASSYSSVGGVPHAKCRLSSWDASAEENEDEAWPVALLRLADGASCIAARGPARERVDDIRVGERRTAHARAHVTALPLVLYFSRRLCGLCDDHLRRPMDSCTSNTPRHTRTP